MSSCRLLKNAFWATHIPNNAKSVPEQIISDADTYHVGTGDFKNTNKRLRKEYILRNLVSRHTNWNKNRWSLWKLTNSIRFIARDS